jgi:hypothetical protein
MITIEDIKKWKTYTGQPFISYKNEWWVREADLVTLLNEKDFAVRKFTHTVNRRGDKMECECLGKMNMIKISELTRYRFSRNGEDDYHIDKKGAKRYIK